MSPLPPPPPDDPHYLRYRTRTLGYCFTLFGSSTISLGLRLWAKRQVHLWGVDDIWIILAWMCLCGILGVNIWQGYQGGKDYSITILPTRMIVANLHAAYWVAVLAAPCITFVKLSVLHLYTTIFGAKPRFVLAVRIFLATCVVWGIAHTAAFTFRCAPITAAWDPQVVNTKACGSGNLIVGILEPINSLQDLIMVVMPLLVIKDLNFSWQKKVSISLIFLFGLAVVVGSVWRTAITMMPGNPEAALRKSAKILHAQLALAIIAACLLTYGPLYPKVRAWYHSLTACFGSRERANMSNQRQISVRIPADLPYDHPSTQRSIISTTVVSEPDRPGQWSRRQSSHFCPPGSIQVEKTLEVEIHPSDAV